MRVDRQGSGSQPLPHPEPPTNLHQIALPMIEIGPDGSELYQCHGFKYGALSFNPNNTGRFNAPNREFGVTYLSTTPEGAFAETILREGSVRYVRTTWPVVDAGTLESHCLCQITLQSSTSIRLVDLTGPLTHLRADARLNTDTEDPRVIQQWSLAFWNHPMRPDGVFFAARHDISRRSIALYNRAERKVSAPCNINLLRDQQVLTQLMTRYKVALILD